MFPLFFYKFQKKENTIIELVLKPLIEAYNIAKTDKNMVNYKENKITKKIVWYLKNSTSISNLYQKRSISIIMRPKEHITIDDICEPDIKFIIKDYVWMEIESKRIYEENNNWSISEYLSSDKGIGRFLSGKYSENENHGGMVGYIQNGNLSDIINNVKKGLKNCNLKKISNKNIINNCISSIHLRTNNDDITIYHLFFYFT